MILRFYLIFLIVSFVWFGLVAVVVVLWGGEDALSLEAFCS